MEEFIGNNIEGAYFLTNNCVDNIRQSENFNQNYIAKRLSEQCDIYKIIIDKLILDLKEYENMKQLQNNSK